ncbi:MAG: hypothetical protein AAF846_18615 [Chloroflexota bacterium]
MNENETNNTNLQFSYSIPIDPQQFLRRECPHCGLPFKLKAPASALVDSLAPAFSQVTDDTNQTDDTPSELSCPYCGHRTESAAFTPESLRQTILHLMRRTILEPELNRFTQDMERTFTHNKFVKYRANRIIRAAQPIIGPEILDMNRVNLLCCKEDIKIKDDWLTSITCPYCAQELKLQ